MKARPRTNGPADRAHGATDLRRRGTYDRRDEAVRELKEGWFNAAYAIPPGRRPREVILKIAPPQGAEVIQYEQNIMATEVASMRLVRQNPAIPVPGSTFRRRPRDLCNADYFFMEEDRRR